MNPRTLNAEHDAEVDASPLRFLGTTVSTLVITRDIQEVQPEGVAKENREEKITKFHPCTW